jgi:hypothetical protein
MAFPSVRLGRDVVIDVETGVVSKIGPTLVKRVVYRYEPGAIKETLDRNSEKIGADQSNRPLHDRPQAAIGKVAI